MSVTGPYLFVKAAGPARLAATDSGLTFASNGERGVLIEFNEKVRSNGPYALRKHCELTVTPADVDGLVAAPTHLRGRMRRARSRRRRGRRGGGSCAVA